MTLSLKCPTTNMNWLILLLTSVSTNLSIIVILFNSNNALGIFFVNGRNLVPVPAANIIAINFSPYNTYNLFHNSLKASFGRFFFIITSYTKSTITLLILYLSQTAFIAFIEFFPSKTIPEDFSSTIILCP